MGRYNFVSPGAAAGDGISEVLTRQREESRRAMLDEITNQNAIAQREATRAQTESMQRHDFDDEFDKSVAGWDINQNLGDVDPKILAEAKKRGLVGKRVQTTPDASATGSTGPYQLADGTEGEPNSIPFAQGTGDPSMMPGYTEAPTKPDDQNLFIGNRLDRDRVRKVARAGELVKALSNPDLSPAERIGVLSQFEAEGINIDSGAYTATARPPVKKRQIYDSDKGTFTDVADNTDVTVIPRTPRVPQDHGQFVGPALDPEGKPIPGKAIVMRNGRMVVDDLPEGIGAAGPKPANPRTAGRGPGRDTVPPGVSTALQNAQRDAAANKPGAGAALQQSMENYISRYNTSPDVRSVVRHALSTEDDATTIEEIVAAYADQLPKAELDQLADLLAVVKGS